MPKQSSLSQRVRDTYADRGFKARETRNYKTFDTKHRTFSASTDPEQLASFLRRHRGFSAALLIRYRDTDGEQQTRTVSQRGKTKKAKSRYYRAEGYNAEPMLAELDKALHKYVPGRSVDAVPEIVDVQIDVFARADKWKKLRKRKKKPVSKRSTKGKSKSTRRTKPRSKRTVRRGKR